MSCRRRLAEWPTVLRTHVPLVSQPQATVLALGSVGMVRARVPCPPWPSGGPAGSTARSRACGHRGGSAGMRPRRHAGSHGQPARLTPVVGRCGAGC
jgi:hypothetical protein